jgi:hypothetical protein
MLKYYMMAFEKGEYFAMRNLGGYYEKQKDYENMLKCYLMVLDKHKMIQNDPSYLKIKMIPNNHMAISVTCYEINNKFCRLDNRLLEQLIPHKDILNGNNLMILNEKIENKEIEIMMVKYAGMI